VRQHGAWVSSNRKASVDWVEYRGGKDDWIDVACPLGEESEFTMGLTDGGGT